MTDTMTRPLVSHPQSDTLGPADTPLERKRRKRHGAIIQAARNAELTLALFRLAADEPRLSLDRATTYVRLDTWEDEDFRRLDGDDARRSYALAWLRGNVAAIRAIARRAGATVEIAKVADEWTFGVRAVVTRDGAQSRWSFEVPAGVTCELVDTGEVEHIPAQTRPKMERHCPESIYAGIHDEAVA